MGMLLEHMAGCGPDDLDQIRRDELRAFLMERRSRLQPGELGLPSRANRRVPGLRRDEVAELIGVSVDWYRRFESGREIRMSPQLIARIARVLDLDPREELTMYRLALPEIYNAVHALQTCLHGRGADEALVSVASQVA
jgi:transcriptional regulator with XRE-family HTH domain